MNDAALICAAACHQDDQHHQQRPQIAATLSRMYVHAMGATYMGAGCVNEHPLVVDGTVLLMPGLHLEGFASNTYDPTFGYVIESDAATMIVNIADFIGARKAAGLPVILEIFASLAETLLLDAIAHTYATQPTQTDLYNGVVAGIFAHAAEAARLALVLPGILARLDSNWGGARWDATYHDIEYDPIWDVCTGHAALGMVTMYQGWLVDAVLQPRITAELARLNYGGFYPEYKVLDSFVRKATAATIAALYASTGVPNVMYWRGRASHEEYWFDYNGGHTSKTQPALDISAWLYPFDGAGDTAQCVRDLAHRGQVPTFGLLTHTTAKDDIIDRLYANRDRGIDHTMLYLDQGYNDANNHLDALEGALATAKGTRDSVPRLLEIQFDTGTQKATLTFDRTVYLRPDAVGLAVGSMRAAGTGYTFHAALTDGADEIQLTCANQGAEAGPEGITSFNAAQYFTAPAMGGRSNDAISELFAVTVI